MLKLGVKHQGVRTSLWINIYFSNLDEKYSNENIIYSHTSNLFFQYFLFNIKFEMSFLDNAQFYDI